VVADTGSAKQLYAQSAALGDPFGEAELGRIDGHMGGSIHAAYWLPANELVEFK
jgi:hypothetical protein